MTNLQVLYQKFLSKITDYRLLKMMDSEIEDILLEYYDTARGKFFRCKQDLTIIEDINGKHVISDLTPYEIDVLVTLMLVEHITPRLISDETMSQSLSDKDFKIYSQANQLRELRLLLERYEQKAERMITQYTFLDLGKESK